VQARDKATGKEQQIRIQASGGLSEADIQKMVKEAEANAAADKKRREFVEAKNHADGLVHQVEKTLKENEAKVSAQDKGTGKEQQIRIQASGGLSEGDIDKMVKDAEAHAEEDKKRKAQVEAKNHAEALVHSTEKTVAEHGLKVGEADRRAIENAIADLKEALKGDDADAITAKTNTLAQASMKLGEAVYKQSAAEQPPGSADAAEGKKEDVVDAEFTEVDDDKKNKKSA